MDVLEKAKFLHNSIQNMLYNKGVLRGKQRDAFDAMVQLSPEQIAHSYFKLPTGFGKTVMFSLLASEYTNQLRAGGADLANNKVVILVPRLSLIEQTSEKLQTFANIDTVSVFNGKNKCTNRDIIISTYQSMENLFAKIGAENIGLVIADEAHHAIGDKRISVLNHISDHAPIIGFTATPVYSEKHAVSDLLGTEIYSMTIDNAVDNEMLCPVKNILYRTSMIFDPSQYGLSKTGEFDWRKIIDEGTEFDIMVREIAQIYARGECDGTPFRNMKTMINCPNIDIATAQAHAINAVFGRDVAIPLHSRQKNFSKLVQDFRDNKFNVVCQVNTLTEGFDDEDVTLCINYPSASVVRIEQASGRALRINQNNPHKMAYVLDTVFRGGSAEPIEDTIITAHEHGQVLFRDVAGGAVLVPERFWREMHTIGEHKQNNTIFFNFDVVTDNQLLMTIEQHYNDWVAAGNKHWLSPTVLKKHCELRASETIENRLVEMRNDPRMAGRIRDMELVNGRTAPCLHADTESIGLFQQILNEKWLSPSQLMKYCELQGPSIENRLRNMKQDPRIQDHIMERQLIGGRYAPCLRNTPESIRLFQQIINERWLSPSVIVNYCESKNAITVEKYLDEMRTDPRMTGCIQDIELQDRRTGKKRVAPHLRGDSKTIGLFNQMLNQKKWLTPSLLREYCEITNPAVIEKRLREMQEDPRIKDHIVDKPIIGGRLVPCLCWDDESIKIFRQIINEKWLTPVQASKKLHLSKQRTEKALNEMRNDPRMKNAIRNMLLQNGRFAPCLRDNHESIDLFLMILKEQKLAKLKQGTAIVAMATIATGRIKTNRVEHKK